MRYLLLILLGLVVLSAPLVAAGEKGFNFERTLTAQPAEARSIIVDGPPKDQRLTVVVRSKDAPVDVCLVWEKDRKEAEECLAVGKPVKTFLAAFQGVEEVSFTVTIKAKTEFAVVLGNCKKKATVSLKMTGM